jgi:hypothetical protein
MSESKVNNKNNENDLKTYNPKAHSPAVYIPCWLIQIPASQLSHQAKLLYGRLAQWSSAKGTVHRSVRQLTEELGFSSDCIERSLKELRELKLIDTYRIEAGGVNYYRFLEHGWMNKPINKNLEYQSSMECSTTVTEKPHTVIFPSSTGDTPPPAKVRVPTRKSAVPKIKRNINTKLTTTTTRDTIRKNDRDPFPMKSSSSSFVIDKHADAKLLQLRDTYMTEDKRRDSEFLKQCKHHLDNGNKEKYNLARRLKGLQTIIQSRFFEIPAGYKENKVIKSKVTPEEMALLSRYKGSLGFVKAKRDTKLEDFMSKKDIEIVTKLIKKHKIDFKDD